MSIKKKRTRKAKLPVPAGYDSRLEYLLHNNELKDWEYHPKERIEYVTPSSYEADFKTETAEGKIILLEVKGRFRTRAEASKYIYIREALNKAEEEAEIIFLFQDANKPMPFVKKRKDGTKQTHGEWAEKNGFRYECVKKGVPKEWM